MLSLRSVNYNLRAIWLYPDTSHAENYHLFPKTFQIFICKTVDLRTFKQLNGFNKYLNFGNCNVYFLSLYLEYLQV